MQAVIFIGIQGSGKTSYYKERFLQTHLRISLDLLRTRNKQARFLQLCLETGQKFVVDNTNPAIADRAYFIELARKYRFKVTGYFFHSSIQEAILRNNQRKGKENISIIGIRATYKKLQPPTYQEGFDELYEVVINEGQFEEKKINRG